MAYEGNCKGSCFIVSECLFFWWGRSNVTNLSLRNSYSCHVVRSSSYLLPCSFSRTLRYRGAIVTWSSKSGAQSGSSDPLVVDRDSPTDFLFLLRPWRSFALPIYLPKLCRALNYVNHCSSRDICKPRYQQRRSWRGWRTRRRIQGYGASISTDQRARMRFRQLCYKSVLPLCAWIFSNNEV